MNPQAVWLDDRVVDFADAQVPVTDRGLQFAESIYEVIPVTRGRPRMLDEHVARMRTGAAALSLLEGVPEVDAWLRIFDALAERDAVDEGTWYAQVTGGTAPRAHVPAIPPKPRFFCYLAPLRFPRADAALRGVGVITQSDVRWGRCDLKTTMLLPAVLAKREAQARGAAEAVFLDPAGRVREGASSNIFAVRDGAVVTPRQTSHVLPGITRTLVTMLAREAGREVRDDSLQRDELLRADEVFLCSTTLLVMPVVAIDGQPVGTGKPGPIALDLAARLRRHFELEA